MFDHPITDPVETVSWINSVFAVVHGALTFMVAIISFNIVANVASQAFDFSNVAPKRTSWQMNGEIAAIGSIYIRTWNLYKNPNMVPHMLDLLGAPIGAALRYPDRRSPFGEKK